MRRMVEVTAAFTLAVSLALVGCTDTSIVTPSVEEPTFFTHEPAPGFSVMRRDVPLATDVEATQTIGPEGGRIDLDAAGIHLVIREGALDTATEITLRARAGSALAFELSPGGLMLDAAAEIRVDFAGTKGATMLSSMPDGTTLSDVLGVHFVPLEGAAEPVGTLRAHKWDGSIVVQTMSLLSGYATASG